MDIFSLMCNLELIVKGMKLNYNMSKTKMYTFLLIGAVVAAIIVGISITMKKPDTTQEHFTEDGHDSYVSRMTTINVFDAYLKRNPTTEEIDKYSKFANEQDILTELMKDFPNEANVQSRIEKGSSSSLLNDIVDKDNLPVVQEEELFVQQPSLSNISDTHEDDVVSISLTKLNSLKILVKDLNNLLSNIDR